jgi:predicted dehydrogenase
MGDTASIALVGAGQIGKRHLAHILAEPTARLHAVVDPAESAQAIAAAAGAPWFPDIGAMLAAGRPDGVLVASPNALHVPHALQTIAAGLPTLVEKPISDDADAARRLVEAAEAAGVPLLVGHHRRHNPMSERVRETIRSGRLGRIIAVHGFFWLLKPDSYFDVAWRREKGAGPVLVNLIHDIDLLRWFCGDIVEVQAMQSSDVRRHVVDETTVLTLRFASGTLGTMSVSDTILAPWSWEHTASEFRDYPRTDQLCFFIGGTHGSISVPRMELWRNEETRGWFQPFVAERLVTPEEDPLRRQVAHLSRVIRFGEAPVVSGREGLKTLLAIAAVQEAARTGQPVQVAP